MQNLLALTDLSGIDIVRILDRADYLADAWKQNTMPQTLKDKQIGLWFFGQGFRNRVAFEIGAKALGASVSYIPGKLGIHEPLEDIGHYLNNWFSILVVRAKNHVVTNALRLNFFQPKNINQKQSIKEEKAMIKTIKIEGMSCMHCVESVKKSLTALEGIHNVNVDLESKTATIEAESTVTDDMLRAAVEDAGYQVV